MQHKTALALRARWTCVETVWTVGARCVMSCGQSTDVWTALGVPLMMPCVGLMWRPAGRSGVI